jgi:hypothetical protein
VLDPTKSLNYYYDNLGRLTKAETQDLTAANTYRLEWAYDRYGNRLSQSLTGATISITAPQLTISDTTNRIITAGYGYDAAGNLINDTLHSYAYDATAEHPRTGEDSSFLFHGNNFGDWMKALKAFCAQFGGKK